ncbi:MAG: HpcH/HpaI aldolase/citrate lyase family protein [Candidatus Dormibacteria bacterium]
MAASSSSRPYRSYLYVPGTDPRRVAKALESSADAVVIDLEDAVAVPEKDAARSIAAAVVAERPPKPTFVRVNGLRSGRTREDVEAVAGPGLAGVRLPKVESADGVVLVASWLASVGCRAGVVPLIESALGVEHAFEIASADRMVMGLAIGEADLIADLGVHDEGLDYARSRCVVAARAAGLVGIVQSVYTTLGDLAGLRASTERGRAAGCVGRSAIHPTQVPVINDVYSPSEAEQVWAEEVVAALRAAAGRGVAVTADGQFVDEAVARRARAVLDLALLSRA